MKNTISLNDLVPCATAEELKVIGEILSQASARSSVHADESHSRVDEKIRSQRAYRLREVSNTVWQEFLSKSN